MVTHPERPDRIVVAISTGGVYRSDDGGDTWVARNQGIEARSVAEPLPAIGQCVHKLAVDAVNPDVLWAQNHWGIYRTDDAGDHWESVGHAGEPDGVPSDFGFPIVSHPEEPDTAYVLPLESDVYRCTPEGRCRVYRTTDGGLSWEAMSDGLPRHQRPPDRAARCVHRRSQPAVPARVRLQVRALFASVDSGESWRLVTSYLPPILCVRVLD